MLAKTSITWGVGLGFALVVGTQVLTWLGLGLSSWFPILTFLLVIILVALGFRSLKQLDGGKLTFPRAALFLFIVILISRIIFQLYMFAYINYVEPDWVDTVAETWTQTMKDADLSDEQILKRIAVFRKAWEPSSMFTIELILLAIPQYVLGIIVSIFFVFRNPRKQPAPNSVD